MVWSGFSFVMFVYSILTKILAVPVSDNIFKKTMFGTILSCLLTGFVSGWIYDDRFQKLQRLAQTEEAKKILRKKYRKENAVLSSVSLIAILMFSLAIYIYYFR